MLNNMGLGFLITAIDQASAVFRQVGQSISGLDGANSKMKQGMADLSGQLQSTGKWLMGFGAAGLGSLGLAAMEASKYGKALAEIQTIADPLQMPLSKIRDLTMGMFTAYGGEIEDQTRALYQSISAGAGKAADAAALLDTANQLAIGGVSDVRSALDGLTNVINAFGLSYGKASDVSDAFFVAIKSGKTTLTELSASVGQLAPTASATGVAFDEMLAAISAVTTRGLKTDMAITGLKAALANVIKPTADAQAEAKRLGIEFTASALRAKGLSQFLKEIMQSSNYNADSFSKLFGSVEGLNAIMALTANGGGTFNQILGDMAKRTGMTSDAMKIMAADAGFVWSLFKSNLKAAIIAVGEAILPLVVYMMQFATVALQAFTNLPAPIKQAIVLLFAAASVISVVVGAAMVLAGIVGGILAAGWEVFAIAIAATINLSGQLAVVFAILGGIVAGFSIAFQKDVGGIATYFKDTAGTVKLAYDAIAQLFSSGTLSGSVLTELNKGSGGVKDFAIEVYLIGQRIVAFFSGIKEGFTDAIGDMGGIFASLKDALINLGQAFGMTKEGPEQAASSWKTFSEVGKTLGQGLASAFGFVVQVFTVGIRVITGVIQGVRAVAGPAFGIMGNAIMAVVRAFSNLFSAFGASDIAGSKTASTWEVIGNVLGGVIGAVALLIAWFANLVAIVVNVVAAVVSSMAQVFSGVITVLSGIIDFFAGVFTGNWTRVWQGLAKIVAGVVQIILGLVFGLVSAIAGLFDSILQTFGVKSSISKTISDFGKGVSNDVSRGLGVSSQEQDYANQKKEGPAPFNPAPVTIAPTQGAPPPAFPTSGPAQGAAAPGAQPGVTAATAPSASMADLSAALNRPAPAPAPVLINETIKVELDGQTLGEALHKYEGGGGRGFGNPTPTAT